MPVQHERICCSSAPERDDALRDMISMSLRAVVLPDCMQCVREEVPELHHTSALASAAMSAKMQGTFPRLGGMS